MYLLRLLGPLELPGLDGSPLPVKQLGLLALVAHSSPRPVPRRYLAKVLWPAASAKAARHSLSQALYSIRRALGEGVLECTGTSVALRPLVCDLGDFRQCLEQGAYEEAAELVRGDFCEQLMVPGCVEFDHWLENARHEHRQQIVKLLDEPLSLPLRQTLHGVVRGTYDEALREAVGKEDPSPKPSFVGRVAERELLDRALALSKEGTVVSALVTGEAGVGKTSLCMRLVKKSVLQGSHALVASAYELQRNLPYGIISQLLNGATTEELLEGEASHWVPVLGKLLPIADADIPAHEPRVAVDAYNYRFAGAFHHIVKGLARTRPVTLFVDDVQWADAASISILHYIAHCEAELPLLILFASRSAEVEFFREGRWEFPVTVPLAGLTLDETRLLLRLSPPGDQRSIKSIHEFAGGNPLLLQAFATRSRTFDNGLPAGIKQYFLRQLAQLSGHAQLLGAALSAGGEPLTAPQLAWLAETDSGTAARAIDELIEQGFVAAMQSDGSFALRHDAIREVFLDNLSAVASSKLHGRVAKALRNYGRPAAVIATQMIMAGDNPETYTYAVQAANASMRLCAYAEAEHFHRVAIGSAPTTGLEMDSRIALSDLLCQQDRAPEAESVLQEFSPKTRLSAEASALLEAHIHIAKVAKVGPATVTKQAFERADSLQPLLPLEVSAKLYTGIALNAQHGLHELLERSAVAATDALDHMPPGPQKVQMEVNLSALKALNAFTTANLEELDELTERSSNWPTTYAACLSAGGLVRIARGLASTAEQAFLRALHVCEQYGLMYQRLKVLNNLGVCYLEQGRWSEADEQFCAVVQAGGAVAPKTVPGAATNLLILQYEQGRYEEAIQWGRRCLRDLPPHARPQLGLLSILGLVNLQLGCRIEARDIEKLILQRADRDAGWSNDISYCEIFAARMATIDGRVAEAERRLRHRIDMFSARDFYCTVRMKVELIRSTASHSPHRALTDAEALRPSLAAAQAAPLVERLDQTMTRCRNRLDLHHQA